MISLFEYVNERKMGGNWKKLTKGSLTATFLHFDEPSKEYGIDGGCISKLEIRKSNKVVCNYDRGWDIKPDKSGDDAVKSFYDEIISSFNGEK